MRAERERTGSWLLRPTACLAIAGALHRDTLRLVGNFLASDGVVHFGVCA